MQGEYPMKKLSVLFLFVILLLAACAERNKPTPPITPTPAVPSFLLPMDRVILRSASYTIVTKNPARTLTELQKTVEKAGGYLSSASSYSAAGSSNYASLSAKVPPEALPALGEAIDKMADPIQNRSVSVQDVTSDVLNLQQRYHDLTNAREELLWFLINDKDLDKFSTFGILQELLDTELKSVESQLVSYEQQSKLASFDITINQPASQALPVE